MSKARANTGEYSKEWAKPFIDTSFVPGMDKKWGFKKKEAFSICKRKPRQTSQERKKKTISVGRMIKK